MNFDERYISHIDLPEPQTLLDTLLVTNLLIETCDRILGELAEQFCVCGRSLALFVFVDHDYF